jgi:hypothetical protein
MIDVGKVFETDYFGLFLIVSVDFPEVIFEGKQSKYAVISLFSKDVNGFYESLDEIEDTYNIISVREF